MLCLCYELMCVLCMSCQVLLVGDTHGRVSVYQLRNVPEQQEDPVSSNFQPAIWLVGSVNAKTASSVMILVVA